MDEATRMIAATHCSDLDSSVDGQFELLAQRLAGVDQLTEQAFLRLGGQIDDGQRRAMALAKVAAALLGPDEGETTEQTVVRLQLLAERCALWLDEAGRQSQAIVAVLAELQCDVATLKNPRHGLHKIVKVLQSLRVATRIEAARSRGHGAQVLGQELHGLSQGMQEKIGHIATRCDVLNSLLERALLVEQQTQDGALAEARAEIGQSRHLLTGVAGQCVRTTDQTALLQRHSAELAASFGELVAALQFQDITRQRLQHITHTLYELHARQQDGGDVASGGLCRLQHEQLRWAADEFTAAVDRLDANLCRMADDVELLADETGAAVMAGGEEHGTRVSASLQAVIACLQKVQTTHLAASQALFAVSRAVGDVTLLTDEVEQLGEEMQLLAQNAAISAAHGSELCAGLTVIAANIQLLAEDAGRHARALTGHCRQVSARAGELDDLDQKYAGRDSDLDTLLIEARTLLDRLRDSGATIDRRVGALGRQARELAGDLQQAIAGFEVRSSFMTAINPVLAGLRALATLDDGAAGVDPLLDDLQRRYTMMSERHVHQRVMSHDEGSGASDNLGDNVELF